MFSNEAHQIHTYQEQAGKIAFHAFQEFDAEKQEKFLSFLKKASIKKNSLVQAIVKDIDSIREGKRRLTSAQMRIFLFAVLQFLPTKTRMEVMILEVLHHIQRQKLAINRNFSRKADIDTAFEIYTQYLTGLHNLGKLAYTWFYENSYNHAEKQDVIAAVEYVQIVKLKASVSHFRKDLTIIAEKVQNLSKRMSYFIDLLGIEVEIPNNKYSLGSFYIHSETQIPEFHSEFQEMLKTYLFEELAQEDYLLAVREMQETVLAHDLETALLHYQQSKNLTNKIDISFELKGGAGLVKLEIKSWLTSWLTSNSSIFKEDVPVLKPSYRIPVGALKAELNTEVNTKVNDKQEISFVPLYIITGFIILVMMLGAMKVLQLFQPFLFAAVPSLLIWFLSHYFESDAEDEDLSTFNYGIKENIDRYYEDIERNNAALACSDFKIFKSQGVLSELPKYESLIKELKEEQAYWAKEGIIFEKMYHHLHKTLLLPLNKQGACYPDYIQSIFESYFNNIQELTTLALADFLMSDKEKLICLDVLKYILAQQSRKARYYFQTIIDEMIKHQFNGFYYINFLEMECIIPPDFYVSHSDLHVQHLEKYKSYSKPNSYDVGKMPSIPTENIENLTEWLHLVHQQLQEISVENEVKGIREYAQLSQRSAHIQHFVLLPLILEGDEGVLYI